MLVTLIIAFNLGLFSTLHCVGMCGGILSSMMLASPDHINKKSVFNKSLVYNIGRICSYSIAGILAGLLGTQIIDLTQDTNAHLILQSIAAIVLLGLALELLGVFPFKRWTESIGKNIWKLIQPFGKRFYPADSFRKIFFLGMLWGWLPCGLVYSTLILSLSTGAAFEGMLTMLFFGLGTLPGLLTAGYLAEHLKRMKSNKQLKIATAILLILIAISLPVSTIYFTQQHDHDSSSSSLHNHH
ncbi:MAG TPA: sulfite exporter TauE/SafE family protein [Thiotrichaceae bacterium]|jgi:sulfite exporter TauE/SafE|nr:sulfite exporter TauE/SafE family protein [Thiotrichaceae bacterium]